MGWIRYTSTVVYASKKNSISISRINFVRSSFIEWKIGLRKLGIPATYFSDIPLILYKSDEIAKKKKKKSAFYINGKNTGHIHHIIKLKILVQ